jgi:hypothetical protein
MAVVDLPAFTAGAVGFMDLPPMARPTSVLTAYRPTPFMDMDLPATP